MMKPRPIAIVCIGLLAVVGATLLLRGKQAEPEVPATADYPQRSLPRNTVVPSSDKLAVPSVDVPSRETTVESPSSRAPRTPPTQSRSTAQESAYFGKLKAQRDALWVDDLYLYLVWFYKIRRDFGDMQTEVRTLSQQTCSLYMQAQKSERALNEFPDSGPPAYTRQGAQQELGQLHQKLNQRVADIGQAWKQQPVPAECRHLHQSLMLAVNTGVAFQAEEAGFFTRLLQIPGVKTQAEFKDLHDQVLETEAEISGRYAALLAQHQQNMDQEIAAVQSLLASRYPDLQPSLFVPF